MLNTFGHTRHFCHMATFSCCRHMTTRTSWPGRVGWVQEVVRITQPSTDPSGFAIPVCSSQSGLPWNFSRWQNWCRANPEKRNDGCWQLRAGEHPVQLSGFSDDWIGKHPQNLVGFPSFSSSVQTHESQTFEIWPVSGGWLSLWYIVKRGSASLSTCNGGEKTARKWGEMSCALTNCQFTIALMLVHN